MITAQEFQRALLDLTNGGHISHHTRRDDFPFYTMIPPNNGDYYAVPTELVFHFKDLGIIDSTENARITWVG
jgi:hypothetical protein